MSAPQVRGAERAAGGRRLNARQAAVLALLDGLDSPVDAEELCAVARQAGTPIPLSSLYRVLAGLSARGLVVELRTRGRRRFLPARRSVDYAIEDGDGRPLAVEVPGLRALLTQTAVEHGLLPTACVTIRFNRA